MEAEKKMGQNKNRLAGLLAYEIGPIDRVDDRGAIWRDELEPFLLSLNIGILNPLKKPISWGQESEESRQWRAESLERAKALCSQNNIYDANKICDAVHEQMRDIVAADLRLVDKADFMIAYIDLDIHTCGSYSEITHAALQRKPVIICCKQGKYQVPMWLYGLLNHQMFFSNWEEVKDYIQHVAFDDNVEHFKRWRFFKMNQVYGREIF